MIGEDDERVALPVAHRITEESTRRIRRRGLAVHVDEADVVCRLVEDGDQSGGIDVLNGIGRCDQAWYAVRKTLRRRVGDRRTSLLHVEVMLAIGRLGRG